MCKTTRNTKAAKIERTITVTAQESAGLRFIVAVLQERHQLKTKVNRTCEVYTLERILDTQFGVGIRFEKHQADGEAYDVNISNALGHQCSCPSGSYRHGECRHIQMAKEAIRLGLV